MALNGKRRRVLKTALGAGLGWLMHETAAAQADPRAVRPQDGDRLVFASGDRKGTVVKLADVPLGGPPVITYPQDPDNGVVRDGSRLNQILLVRLEPAELTEASRARAAQGVVAYSAVCTHAGCDEWAWLTEQKMLKCPCHDSEFDPKDGARVHVGPATRRLPTLPLKIVDGAVLAAGGFAGRIGAQQG
jgi:Rieske Fe-S protein